MSKEEVAGQIIPEGVIIFIFILMIIGIMSIYDDCCSTLDKDMTININITGKDFKNGNGIGSSISGCYYEGRKYGCWRNLSKILEIEEVKE